jgi:acyl carrier protein
LAYPGRVQSLHYKTRIMDDIQNFAGKIEAEIEDMEKGSLKPETEFRKIENWSSMHALIIIALVDTEYDVRLTGDDLRQCVTINDIYTIVKSRAN